MLQYYFNTSPNPTKVALCLEEMELPYEPMPVDTRKGEQFAPAYVALNPNSKVPTLVDGDAVIFDSNAILLYLGEKTGKFMPGNTPAERGALLSWLMFVASGVGPFAGQAVHFKHFAPETVPYAANRYAFEAERHFGILEARLGQHEWMLGTAYTVVDMAVWGWCNAAPFVLGAEVWDKHVNLKRHFAAINARPAAAKVGALKQKFTFKADWDAEARKNMFPQNERLAAE